MNKRILSGIMTLLMLMASAVFIQSCDDDESSGPVELLSFGPSGVHHGDEISFVGKNLTKVTAIDLPGVTVTSAEFLEQTERNIVIVVPEAATAGKVTLKTTEGDITSKTILSFEVPVVIESIPEEVKPGTNLTITGEFMNWVEEVWFAENVQGTIVSQSLSELVIAVPLEAETGTVTLLTGGTKPLTILTENELVLTLPEAETLSPADVEHTEDLTITGTNLDLVKELRFSGSTATSVFKSQSESQIVVTVPKTAITGPLTLIAKSLVEVNALQDVSILLPVATDLSPLPADENTEVTITGTNLDMVEGIKFPGVDVAVTSFTSQSATEIVVTSPVGVTNGAIMFITHDDVVTLSGIAYVLPGEDLTPLSYVIYDDVLKDGWQNWSWGGAADDGNNEQVRFGTKAIKKTYDGSWDGVQLGGASSATTGYTKFSISIYGDSGTEGKLVNLVLNGAWGTPAVLTIHEGVWTEYDVLWSEAGNTTSPLTQIAIQAQGWSGVVWMDKIGFK